MNKIEKFIFGIIAILVLTLIYIGKEYINKPIIFSVVELIILFILTLLSYLKFSNYSEIQNFIIIKTDKYFI